MKKYFTVMMGCRGEIESPEIMEIESIRGEIKRRKDELIEGLKSDEDMSKSDIKDYVDEWWIVVKYDYGCDVGWGEEESCIYIDMDSEMFKKWEGGVVEEMGGNEFYWEDVSEEKVWDLLNMFWG
jgi:hypothetical protein